MAPRWPRCVSFRVAMGQGSARPVTSKQSHDGQSQSLQLRWGCSSMQGLTSRGCHGMMWGVFQATHRAQRSHRNLDVEMVEESPLASFQGFILDFWYRPGNRTDDGNIMKHLSFTWKLHPVLDDLRIQESVSLFFPAHVWLLQGSQRSSRSSFSPGWRPYMEDFHFAMHSLGGDWSDTAAFGVSGFFTRSFCLMNFLFFFLGGGSTRSIYVNVNPGFC